jgi:hypothetical protein
VGRERGKSVLRGASLLCVSMLGCGIRVFGKDSHCVVSIRARSFRRLMVMATRRKVMKTTSSERTAMPTAMPAGRKESACCSENGLAWVSTMAEVVSNAKATKSTT